MNIFNAALVTPTYYVMFTTATIVTSAILFRGFKGSAVQIATVVIGFLQICAGVILLQLSKSAKDVPDAAVFKGDLDQVREVAAQEEPETEPKADSIRGAAAIIRRLSTPRRNMEVEEARRYFRERQEDLLKPPAENEIIEWDGLRRRKTVIGEGPTMARSTTPRTPSIRKSLPPLGMSRFPEEQAELENVEARTPIRKNSHSFFDGIRSRASSVLYHRQWNPLRDDDDTPVNLGNVSVDPNKTVDTSYYGPQLQSPFQVRRERSDTSRTISWADDARSIDRNRNLSPVPPADGARRQFSFKSVFNRTRSGEHNVTGMTSPVSSPPRGILKRPHIPSGDLETVTEEERLGLSKGDSRTGSGDDKLERKWSSSSGSSSGDVTELLKDRYTHTRQQSVSSSSSSAPPPYEEEQYHNLFPNADNDYIHPPSGFVTTAHQNEEVEGNWQLPISQPGATTTRTAPPMSPALIQPLPSRSNPLPPLPTEIPAVVSTGDGSYVRVGLHSPSPSNSDMGVMSISSLSSTPSRRSGLGRRESGWRRHDSVSSGDTEDGSMSSMSDTRGHEAFV